MSKPLALAAVLLASAPAFADSSISIRFMSRDASDPVLTTAATENYATGGLTFVDAAANSFIAYCVEPAQSFALSTKAGGAPNFKTYTVGSFSGAQGSLLQALYSSSYGSVQSGDQQAAFQLAVWEIVTETSGSPLGVAQSNGAFYVKTAGLTGSQLNTANTVQGLADGYLAAAQSYQGVARYDLVKLSNSAYQDLVLATPTNAVPEPQTYALLLAGLGVIGLVARRRLPR